MPKLCKCNRSSSFANRICRLGSSYHTPELLMIWSLFLPSSPKPLFCHPERQNTQIQETHKMESLTISVSAYVPLFLAHCHIDEAKVGKSLITAHSLRIHSASIFSSTLVHLRLPVYQVQLGVSFLYDLRTHRCTTPFKVGAPMHNTYRQQRCWERITL